ncbi:MAG: DUF2325 domain-containing protein [Bacillota bacterium]|nr:DUF2325 domain-containing protein [Bacillota bacterium]
MPREAVARVIGLLRAAREGLYRRLHEERPGPEEERELVDRAHDLLLLEEGLRRYEDDLVAAADGAGPGQGGTGADAPPPLPPAEAEEWDHVGEFTRLVRGGILNESRSGREIFVPEAVVRAEGIEHGDLIGARDRGVNERGAPVYYFQVLERRGLADTSGRASFVAPLEQHGGAWGAYSEEEETFVTVPPQDVTSLDLAEGDLVEIAYEAGDFSTARVAWRYDPGEAFLDVREPRTAPRRDKRERPAKEAAADDRLPLDGVNVLVVGADAYKESFKRMFERLGASFTWESGFMVGRFLEGKVKRADIVVIVTEAMKHKMPDVENICERYGRPYVYAPSRGATGAVREVLRKLEKDVDG